MFSSYLNLKWKNYGRKCVYCKHASFNKSSSSRCRVLWSALLHLPLSHARQDGGAIYVHPTGTITFNDFATFTENTCFDVSALYQACAFPRGQHIYSGFCGNRPLTFSVCST